MPDEIKFDTQSLLNQKFRAELASCLSKLEMGSAIRQHSFSGGLFLCRRNLTDPRCVPLAQASR